LRAGSKISIYLPAGRQVILYFMGWGKCKILNSKMVAEKLSFGVEPKLFEKLNFGTIC
jgi:hypothetical protein